MQKLSNNIHHAGTTEMNSNNVVLQQDDAPSHTARNIISYLWPANSPDLNMIDYAVWGALQ